MCMQPQWCVSPTASSPLHVACPGFVSYLSCRMLWWYRPLRYSEREGQHTGVFTYQWSSVAPCFPSSSTVCGIGRMPPMTMSWSSVSMSTILGFLVVAAAAAPAVCAPITIVTASSIMVRRPHCGAAMARGRRIYAACIAQHAAHEQPAAWILSLIVSANR
eukprot:COSAG01_NODE_32_length_35644_cov_22.273738_30_plen_161_part_00